MSSSPFTQDHAPVIGAVEQLSDKVRAITCGNASPMTYTGTRSYIYGRGQVALIDPGPQNEPHLDAILRALEPNEEISHILITHSHIDHSPLAQTLKEKTGAPIFAFGTSHAGRSETMQILAENFDLGGGEGIDAKFQPDQLVTDGAVIKGLGWELEVIHTPGHLSNHISFADGTALFSGDIVMGWATSLVSPPDGDLTQFMASLNNLLHRSETTYYPGHGAPVENPQEIVEHLLTHRKGRESQIINNLGNKPHTIQELTEVMYQDISKALHPAAARNVFAHLIDLTTREIVNPKGPLSPDAIFHLR